MWYINTCRMVVQRKATHEQIYKHTHNHYAQPQSHGITVKHKCDNTYSNVFFHLSRYKVTIGIELPQLLKLVDARERLNFLERPNDLIDLRGRFTIKADIGYVRAVKNKKVELWELVFIEGKLVLDIRLVQEHLLQEGTTKSHLGYLFGIFEY